MAYRIQLQGSSISFRPGIMVPSVTEYPGFRRGISGSIIDALQALFQCISFAVNDCLFMPVIRQVDMGIQKTWPDRPAFEIKAFLDAVMEGQIISCPGCCH